MREKVMCHLRENWLSFYFNTFFYSFHLRFTYLLVTSVSILDCFLFKLWNCFLQKVFTSTVIDGLKHFSRILCFVHLMDVKKFSLNFSFFELGSGIQMMSGNQTDNEYFQKLVATAFRLRSFGYYDLRLGGEGV